MTSKMIALKVLDLVFIGATMLILLGIAGFPMEWQVDGKTIVEVFSRKIVPPNDQSSSSVMPGSPFSIARR